MIQSVVTAKRNGPLVAVVAALWIRPEDLVLDVTYGRGLFWTEFQPARFAWHDLAIDGVDFRKLPEADGSVDVVVFDPPHIAPGGRKTSTIPDFNDRYGLVDAPRTVKDADELIAAGIREARRVLTPRGRLLLKCIDYVSGGRYRPSHHRAVEYAMSLGFEQVDEFVHHSGPGPQPLRNRDGTPRRQVHSRRVHSFLSVFRA